MNKYSKKSGENMKKVFLFGIMSVFLLALSLGVSALTINTPASGGTVSGTYNFTATTALVANASNCTFATTADGVFATSYNRSVNQTLFWNSTVTTALTDASSTVLNVTCYNNTNEDSAVVTIAIDNTAPTAVLSELYPILDIYGQQDVSCRKSSDATTAITCSYTLTKPDSSTATTTTTSSSESFFNDGDLEESGSYTVTLTVTDAGSNSATDSETFDVKRRDKAVAIEEEIAQEKSNRTRNIVIGGVVLVVIIASAGYYILSPKKKRR